MTATHATLAIVSRETLQLHTYMTAGHVNQMATNDVAREESVRVFRGMGIQKIILEVYRGGTTPTDKTLIAMRDWLTAPRQRKTPDRPV